MMRNLQVVIYFISLGAILTNETNSTSDIMTKEPIIDTGTQQLPNAINELGLKLIKKMLEDNKYENIIISPTGIAGLLAMALTGTVGKTYEELADALGFSHDVFTNRLNHDQLGALFNQLNTEKSSKTQLANSIFVDEKTRLRELYQMYLKVVYNSDTFNVNFKDNVAVKEQVNEWVKNKTEGKIDNFLENPPPQDTRIMLLTALYFRGQWEHIFFKDYTMKMDFHTNNATAVKADLMANGGKFAYVFSKKYGAEMLALPYNDSTTTMYVLKPIRSTGLSITELLANLDHAKIDEMINKMEKKECVIRFPKMELRFRKSMEQYLAGIGIKSMFNKESANFGLMVENDTMDVRGQEETVNDVLNRIPNPGIYVDSVLHDVKITINEYGTEAAAATVATLLRSAALFYVDSPFYMFIRNEKTKLVTFSGVIFDPTV